MAHVEREEPERAGFEGEVEGRSEVSISGACAKREPRSTSNQLQPIQVSGVIGFSIHAAYKDRSRELPFDPRAN